MGESFSGSALRDTSFGVLRALPFASLAIGNICFISKYCNIESYSGTNLTLQLSI